MYPYNLGLLADSVALKAADTQALCYEDRTYSYAELTRASEAIAKEYRQRGLTTGDVLAIVHTKKPLAYAAMLAALRLGLPYVILDAESPDARTARILATAAPRLILIDANAHLPEDCAIPVMNLSDCTGEVSEEDICERKRRTKEVDGACIAYIMFTSGSTGMPKGVAVSHQNVLHFIEWGARYFELAPGDILANVSPMYFDNSVFDFYCGLFSGAALAPIDRALLHKPYELVAYVDRLRCTVWFSVPSLLIYLMTMKALSKNNFSSIRSISFGGEGYPKAELAKLYALYADRARIVNVYGPTECTCICSAYPLKASDFADCEGLPPLGRINQNFDWYIDEGELILAGPNVAHGYYNDPERTKASFQTLLDPKRFGKRIYRTGDLVCARDGLLYFQGRKDNQIKHMGYRIELEEIEKALLALPGIHQAAVLYVRTQTAFGKLYGFAAYEGERDSQSLLKDLAHHLPAYMIPSSLTLLRELPHNANGKVDRQGLRETIIHNRPLR
ncbi:MAG: AMP-binding protein [Desulfovibrionaceae bacterium]|nr:AMP-binding protein [Desulfovibrionaceae bacterium]